jgi:hypothetical protein
MELFLNGMIQKKVIFANPDSLYSRYSDYGNKYLNYNSDIKFATDKKNYKYINNGVSCLFSTDPKNNFHLIIAGATNFYEACKLLEEGKENYSSSNAKGSYYSSASATQKEGVINYFILIHLEKMIINFKINMINM